MWVLADKPSPQKRKSMDLTNTRIQTGTFASKTNLKPEIAMVAVKKEGINESTIS